MHFAFEEENDYIHEGGFISHGMLHQGLRSQQGRIGVTRRMLMRDSLYWHEQIYGSALALNQIFIDNCSVVRLDVGTKVALPFQFQSYSQQRRAYRSLFVCDDKNF